MAFCKFFSIFSAVSTFISFGGAYKINARPPSIPPAGAIESAQKISTGNPSKCPSGTMFFPQPIDHATFNGNWNDSNSVFLNQYQVNDTFYKPGGPILFYQGTENPSIACLESMEIVNWAEELNALMVTIEHRYFGISTPYGLNYTEFATWSTASMKPLTIQNALQDTISLITWIKTEAYPSAKDANVIMISGSYGGTLALLYQTHYANDIHASVALSPVTKGLTSDPKDPMTYAFGNWMNMIYNDYSVEASNIIRQGMQELRSRMSSGNFDGLQSTLQLCTQPNSTQDLNSVLLAILAGYTTIAQDDYAFFNYPFLQSINATTNATDPISAIGAAMALYNSVQAQECVRWDPPYTAKGPFWYLRCTQIPYANPSTHADSIFGEIIAEPSVNATHYLDPYCQAGLGIDSIDGGTALQEELKLDDATLQNTERLLVVEGLIDPTTGLGPTSWLPGSSRNHSRIMWVGQSGHGEVGRRPASTDSTALTEARLYIINSMKGWLGMTK